MMENHGYNQIIGNTQDAPYLNHLASTYGLAMHYYGVTHPSLPNYLSIISGYFQGIWDDCMAGSAVTCNPEAFRTSLSNTQYTSASGHPHMFNGQTLVDQLAAHHLTWKAYMQSLPSAGFTGGSDGNYVQKHDPFMYFSSIRNSPARMQDIVPFTAFARDMQSRTVPNFVWISPDVCNDMHGGSTCNSNNGLIAQGDNFVRAAVQQIMHSTAWKEGSAIVITWDENESSNVGCCNSPTGAGGVMLGGGYVPLIVITSMSSRHIVLTTGSYNHYSLLATFEFMWNLGCLAQTCTLQPSSLLTPLFM
jgi:phospholipase C